MFCIFNCKCFFFQEIMLKVIFDIRNRVSIQFHLCLYNTFSNYVCSTVYHTKKKQILVLCTPKGEICWRVTLSLSGSWRINPWAGRRNVRSRGFQRGSPQPGPGQHCCNFNQAKRTPRARHYEKSSSPFTIWRKKHLRRRISVLAVPNQREPRFLLKRQGITSQTV